MRKIYSLVLMAAALLLGTNAWAETRTAGTFQQLQNALSAAVPGDVIELTADITWTDHSQSLLINKSISLDGKGKKITGYGDKQATLKIIGVENSQPTVAISNLTIDNKGGIAILIGGYLDSLCIENSTIESSASISGNPRAIEFVGPQSAAARIGIKNSVLKTTWSGYPLRSYNPMILRLSNTKTSGYCALNFQPNFNTSGTVPPIEGYIGTRGTKVYAENCDFDAPNIHSGKDNGFACFALRDDGIDFHLTNCGMNAEILGNAQQQAFDLGGWWAIKDRLTEVLSPESKHDINITIDGDNSHINGDLIASMLYVGVVPTTGGKFYFMSETGFTSNYNGGVAPAAYMPESAFQYKANINFTIKGGTYAIDPSKVRFHGHILPDQLTDEEKASDPDNYSDDKFESLAITIPNDYEVKAIAMEGVADSLYRVVKKAAEKTPGVLYDLNDLVAGEGVDEGNNPVSSFELSTGTDMTLNQETTTAGYVQVKEDGSGNGTTVTVGTDTQDQTLIINNGLDVQGTSKVDVQPGSALVVGDGGIVTENSGNIVLNADANDGCASLLLDPTVTVNQTPELTVMMKAEQVGIYETEFYWHRFAMPVASISALPHTPNTATAIYGWDYNAQDWYALSGLNQLVPFAGYALTVNGDRQDVTYTFQGNLTGNINTDLAFSHQGYNFFGNSYTGYIKVSYLANEIIGNADIDASIWMWNPATQSYAAVGLQALKDAEDGGYATAMYPNWQREIAPMQTFILRLPNTTSATAEVDYAATIWANPRYAGSATPAPARANAEIEGTIVRLSVADANGNSDEMLFMEKDSYSDAYDRGYDATKYMNSNNMNMYTLQNGEKLSAVATDNLNGKSFDIETKGAISYTLIFDAVLGETNYAVRDNVTGATIAMNQGGTYTFTAQPNSTVAGRFTFVPVQNMPTDVETVEANSNVRGIFTITGQYVGEDFESLPAGVYVVDGVKIVK